MPATNLKSLIGKPNSTCRKALELPAAFCLSQTHYEVDVEHFLFKFLDIPDTDFQKILRYFEINEGRLGADLTRAMEGFKPGNTRNPALSPRIPLMVQDAWLILIPTEAIEKVVLVIRDQKVLLDSGLTEIYGVEAQIAARKACS